MKRMPWRMLALTIAIFGTSCASALASEYYDVGPNYAVYLAWTEDSAGHLQGQVEIVNMGPSNSTQLRTTNAAFTGTHSGSDVSLTFGFVTAFSGKTWTGRIGWGTLSLIIPTNNGAQRVTLHAGSFDQFHAAVSRMKRSVSVNQARVAMYNTMNEAADYVKSGYNSMNQGLATLRSMLPLEPKTRSLRTDYAEEWQRMQNVWHKEEQEGQVAPMTCYQKGQVEYESGQVDYELGQFQYLDGQVDDLQGQYANAFSNTMEGLETISKWGRAYDASARNYYASIGRSYNHNTVAAFSPQMLNAQKSLTIFAVRWDSFKAYYKAYDRRAKRLDDEAKLFAKSITCNQ